MTATFHGPDQRHQHQIEEDRQREKGESPASVPGQQQQEEKEENNSGEDDPTYGPRDCDIGKSSSVKLHLLLLIQHANILLQQTWWTGSRPELWIWITSVSVVMWQLWARVWNIRSSLEVYAIANVR
jgi:hypothetical protein